ncbi:mannose-6-phosphate isomerase 1-like [Nicotiana tomentosiformis]|uniref:mannose-6-phosphate isomerase 1-like n=1 Tax=Nicotiana tomentosiformis TaxID=4098 RepID=UPI00051AF9AF|nr:mannose-6-phosphate isomerase 1-like [Nicotiana tomentosiformis]XP_016466835.1 PREDICTED: mannose-6-phosphate isomerase 1-like isoform X1 [Nicotiana tabacum]
MEEGGGLVRLKGCVKNYDWGRLGKESRVARLYSRNNGDHTIEQDKPYAEFWIGTHDSGPSYVVDRAAENGLALTLKNWIESNPSVVGDKIVNKWGTDLPFLFKVLSVAKALSIQAHPDKDLATRLHNELPDVYKDDNHKPEMALALTEFEALCGFISLEELKMIVQTVPEIIEVVGNAHAEQVLDLNEDGEKEKVKLVLQSVFTEIMSASKDMIAEVIAKLISRLHIKNQARQLTEKEQVVLRLEKQYPADVGVLAAFLLNYVKLKPGEALYLGANEPHAYIYGDCVEIMATSDNVVRAGLTPKHRDVKTLSSMLTYRQGFPEILNGTAVNPHTMRYIPPFEEFEVDRCILPKQSTAEFPAIPGPSIFMVMEGEGTMTTSSGEIVCEGDVLFAAANTSITVATSSGLHLYRAGVSSSFF